MHDQDVFLERALLDLGRVDSTRIKQARCTAHEQKCDFVDALIRLESITSRELAIIKAGICEAPYIELSNIEPCFANTALIPRSVAERYCIFPLFCLNGVLTLAMDDPLDIEAADHARQLTRCEVDAVLADREQLRALISRAYSLSHVHGDAEARIVNPSADEEDRATQPVVAAVNQLISDAVDQRASDIHLNPDEHELHVRYRIDGMLQERQAPSLSMHASLVQRLKVMANLDLTQTRRPQDGKFRFIHREGAVDVRISIVPTVVGENVVLRLLARTEAIGDFVELGVPHAVAEDLEQMLSLPHGMLLVTGPTGSGKTTTLYTALSRLNHPSRNIMTVEDPVEIRMPYVRQIQVHSEIGMTFANALRSILRQDPDVVLVGEIRDEDTARIALQAALTGHVVLSTVHTNDAVGAVARLRDFGLPRFVINSAVVGVIGQRLVRRVCEHCSRETTPSQLLRDRFRLGPEDGPYFAGTGCRHCAQSGYRGRSGVYELLHFGNEVQRAVEAGASSDELRRIMRTLGMRCMWEDGLDKARLGVTTLEEVARVASAMQLEEHHSESDAMHDVVAARRFSA